MKSGQDPLVSIIVVNYNGRGYLYECLNSALKTNYTNFEIIFVDNGSTDSSFEYVEEFFGTNKKMRLIHLKENKGFAEGNNVGILVARGDLIAFLNNDTKVEPDWLTKLVEAVMQNSSVGIAQSKLLSYYESNRLKGVGGILDIFGNTTDEGKKELDDGQYDERRTIFFACFAAVLVKKEVIKKIGLLDSTFFAYYEDVDFCWRARLNGYDIIRVPNSRVLHLEGGTSKKTPKILLFHLRKNRLAILLMNLKARTLFKVLPFVLFEYTAGFFGGIFLTGNSLNLTFMESIVWNLKNFRYVYGKRIFLQNLKKSHPVEITDFMYKGNLLIEKILKEKSVNGLLL